MKRLACVTGTGTGTRTVLVLTLLLALPGLVTGCGSVGRPGSGSAASPSPSAPSGTPPAGPNQTGPGGNPAAALTDTDLGRTVLVHKGDRLSVALHQVTGFSPWSHPASSDGTVLQPVVDTRAAAVRGVTLGSFQAMAPGTVQVTSSAAANCPQGAACPAVARAWTVTVQVS
jgi:hypothetical protein